MFLLVKGCNPATCCLKQINSLAWLSDFLLNLLGSYLHRLFTNINQKWYRYLVSWPSFPQHASFGEMRRLICWSAGMCSGMCREPRAAAPPVRAEEEPLPAPVLAPGLGWQRSLSVKGRHEGFPAGFQKWDAHKSGVKRHLHGEATAALRSCWICRRSSLPREAPCCWNPGAGKH